MTESVESQTENFGFSIKKHAGSNDRFYISKDNGRGKVNRWYHLEFKTVNLSEQEAQETLKKVLEEYARAIQKVSSQTL